jgi:hypothetical protein
METKEKNLVVHLNFDKKLAPGQKVSWSLEAKDLKGTLINGEALITMYDRSLEHYAQFGSSWIAGLFTQKQVPYYGASSTFQPYAGYISVEKGWIKKILEQFQTIMKEPELPMLRLQSGRVLFYQSANAPASAAEGDLSSLEKAKRIKSSCKKS